MSATKNISRFSGGCVHFLRHYGKLTQVYSAMNAARRNLLNCYVSKESIKGSLQYPQYPLSHLYSTQVSETELVSNPTIISNFAPLKFEDMPFEQPVPHENVIKELMKCKTIGEQMTSLISTLGLSPEDVQRRVKFCKALEAFFEPFFYNLRIQMFGSSVNGFGFKGCDIDMTFETTSTQEEIHYLERPDIPLVSEVLCGKVSPQDISNLPRREQLLFLHTVFLEFYKDSKDAPIFINAHVPLVRFKHDKFNLKCDLTSKNSVAYANTKLLYFFAKLDKRMVPLMMTLRYWAKHVELVGKGLMFNSYTMTLLVIHYLQRRNPPVLPSAEYVKTLSETIPDGFESEDMDDKSFLDILDKIPPSKNTETLEELLRGFFFYYLYFDFTRVICPLIASSVPRDEFFSDDRNHKFRMNSVCVQDPMSVTHNVAELVDYKHCKKLFYELMIACKIFQDNNMIAPSSGPWGLIAILDKPKNYSVYNMAVEKLVSFNIPVLLRTADGRIIPEQNRVQVTAEIVHKILDHVLLFQVNKLEQSRIMELLKQQDELIAKQRIILENLDTAELQSSQVMRILKRTFKSDTAVHNLEPTLLEQFQNFTSDHTLISCSECRVSKNTWLGREFAELNTMDTPLDILDTEHLISVATAKQNKRNISEKNVKSFIFLYECYISSNAPDTSLIINFRPLQRMSFNIILGIFLQEYIPKIIQNINNST